MIQQTLNFKVRYAETDQMKIAHHSNYIVWFEMGRIDFMEKLGLVYKEMEKDGYLMPVTEVNAEYVKPASFGEELKIITTMKQKPSARIRFDYEILNHKDERICSGFSKHGFMNLENKAIKPPKTFRTHLSQYF
jgi:acyl-CoA thioester hydrolase